MGYLESHYQAPFIQATLEHAGGILGSPDLTTPKNYSNGVEATLIQPNLHTYMKYLQKERGTTTWQI